MGIGADANRLDLDSLVTAMKACSPKVTARRAHEVLGVDAREALLNCPVPVLYIQASHDRIVQASAARAIVELRSDVVVEQIRGPHLILQRAPKQAFDAIMRWWQNVKT